MTSHLSTSNHRTRPKPVLRRNREPLSSDLLYNREEKALNNSLITRLKQELDMRATRLSDARENVARKGVECEHADLRLEATTSIRDKLVKTREMFTFSTNLPTGGDVEQIVSGLEVVSPNLLAVTESLNMGSDFIKDIDRRVEEATLAVRMAQDAVCRSLEEEKAALIREEQCSSILNVIQRNIDEIDKISGELESRAIFRIHDEIWREIFLWVVNDADPLIDSFPAVTISAVSYSWRTNALSYPALWRNILMRPFGFTLKDADRITHFRRQSGDRILHATLQFDGPPSERSLELLRGSVKGMEAVDSMLITGNPRGEMTRVCSTSVTCSTLNAIRRLKRLEIKYASEFRAPAHTLPDHIIEGLETLELRNCTLTEFKEPGRTGGPSRLAYITLARRASSSKLRWDLFRDWIVKSETTLKGLSLEAAFSRNHVLINTQPAIFSRLVGIRTNIEILLLLFNSSVHTPALRALAISLPGRVNIDAWLSYATDPRGGRGIKIASIIGTLGANDIAPHTACLKALPRLAELTLYGKNVEPLLEALNPQEAGNKSARPLAKLRNLTVIDYKGDGDNILLFAIRYQPECDGEKSSSRGVASTLRVCLQNCPNISSYVSRQLREIGSID